MARVARLYLRLFLGVGIPIAAVLQLGDHLSGSGWTSRNGVINLACGVAVSTALLAMTIRGHRGLGGDFSPDQEMAVRVSADCALVRQRAVGGLRTLPARIVPTVDADRIVARTGRTFGEETTLDLQPAAAATGVVVRSRPIVPFTVTDYGRGRRNVEHVATALAIESGQPTVTKRG